MTAKRNKQTKSLSFALNRSLLAKGSALAIEVTSEAPKAFADALANNRSVFPPGNFILGSGQVKTHGDKDIVFRRKPTKATVGFRGSNSIHSGLALLDNPNDRLKELGFEQAEQLDLSFDAQKGTRYLMLSWGYDLRGAGKGSVALGAIGKSTFGVEAAREASCVFLRRISDKAKALYTLTETIKAWRMPTQIKTASDIPVDSWIVTEVDGSIAVKLGAQFGYDFNWVREFRRAGLKGDRGLKVLPGAHIALGFRAGGNYALVLNRSSSKPHVVRLRLFNLRKKGWDFAFNSAASVSLIMPDLPDQADDFIEAILGVHGSQVLRNLQTIEKWSDPDTPMGELIEELGIDYGFELLTEITGIDAKRSFARARSLLQRVLSKWNKLPNETAAAIWKMMQESYGSNPQKARSAIKEVQEFARAIVDSDAESIGKLVSNRLSCADFFRTPAGTWLEALAGGSLLGLVQHTGYIKNVARKTVAVLDGGKIEQVLRRIQKLIEKRLNLAQVIDLTSNINLDTLDRWLKLKLANFIDETIDSLSLAKVLEIRKTISVVLEKRREFYQKAVVALSRQYQFSFAAAFQEATTRTALLDVEFAFNRDSAEASKRLQAAVDGDFNGVLVDSIEGVKLNMAALTHGIRRQASVEVSLPYLRRRSTHINQVLARVNATEEDGRLLLYDLRAGDRISARNRQLSELTVAVNLPVNAMGKIRVWNPKEGSIAYSFKHAKPMMKVAELEFQLRPLVSEYFIDSFGNGKGTVREWVRDLDAYIEEIERNGSDRIGNTLLSLELTYPIAALAGWLNATMKENTKEYRELSRAIQRSLRKLIPFYYFEDPDHCTTLAAAAPLLVYQNLPVSTQIRLVHNRLTMETSRGVFWDWRQKGKLEAMAQHPSSRKGLEKERIRIMRLLSDLGHERAAREYRNLSAEELIRLSLRGQALSNLKNLLFVEEDIIRGAIRAGRNMAGFLGKATDRPSLAIEAFAQFGAELTESFNKRIRGIYGASALRTLGPMVFVEASRALLLSKRFATHKPDVLLTLSIMKKEIRPFPPKGFPDNPVPQAEDLVTEQRLVAVGSSG